MGSIQPHYIYTCMYTFIETYCQVGPTSYEVKSVFFFFQYWETSTRRQFPGMRGKKIKWAIYSLFRKSVGYLQTLINTPQLNSGLDIKLVDAVARGASRFENLLAPPKNLLPPPQKLTGPFLGYISLRYQCIIVIIHRASCI